MQTHFDPKMSSCNVCKLGIDKLHYKEHAINRHFVRIFCHLEAPDLQKMRAYISVFYYSIYVYFLLQVLGMRSDRSRGNVVRIDPELLYYHLGVNRFKKP